MKKFYLIAAACVLSVVLFVSYQKYEKDKLRNIKIQEQSVIMRKMISISHDDAHLIESNGKVNVARIAVGQEPKEYESPWKQEKIDLKRRYDDLEQWLKEN